MQNKDKTSIILSKFISEEIAAVYKKYRDITDDQANRIGKLVERLEKEQVDFYDLIMPKMYFGFQHFQHIRNCKVFPSLFS